VLVVDDEPANLTAVCAILEPLGQRLVTALSGEEALRRVLDDEFAAILMDVRMPGLDGYETARLIKAREKSAHVPIIFMTALDADPAHELTGYEHGAVDYLFKPLDPQILRGKVAVFVELHLRGETIRRQQELLHAAERAGLEREGELRLRRLTDLMPLCLWVAAPDGAVVSCNQVWTELSGLDAAASGSLGELAAAHPDDRERGRAAWRRGQAEVAAYETELRLRGRDGAHRWYLVRAVPERDDAGALQHWIATATDVDEKKRAEEARLLLLARERAARAEAEAANRAKDDFLATLSHELRTPLNAILGWTHILRHEEPDGETEARALETLDRNARSLRQLIDDMLDVSGIIAGKLQLERGPVDLAAIVDAAVGALQPSIAATGLAVELLVDAPAPFFGDARRLQQVVLNLLANAVKFTPRGGWVRIGVAHAGESVELTVEDGGVGIDPAFLPFVFDRFRQAENSTARGHGGLGLGLAIARHIVELHGGGIAATSAGAGQGTRFTVSLPLVAPHPAREVGAAVPTIPDLGGIRVLLVDDSEDVRLLAAHILERRGATCCLAGSIAEAFDELARSVPDVLVADISLPREDGYSLIRRIRAHESAAVRALPVAALTAHASAADARRAVEAGFDLHLPKPVAEESLIGAVAQLAARKTEQSSRAAPDR